MTSEAIYVVLQSAIERSKGAADWSDVAIAVMQAKERKVREQLLAIVGDYGLEDLMTALQLAQNELFKKNQRPDTAEAPPVSKQPQPTVAKKPKHGKKAPSL